ncbi:hypothetical protein EV44_g3707 [Erysiphe necator]|uniref:Uncharacterized protein n=1 Tax=Uncinula necator TaxID=52586 RepID=A0A0B1P0I1_UNCNE|nr:hypothetical protein EV44_g3707 [Erysiphe necator]
MTDSMDISQDSQAPSTERSQQPPPISPNHNPSPSIASPSPPSITSADSRQMFKPVASSKLPIPERPLHNSRNHSDIANAFIPKELAEIIATRQRRECAWYPQKEEAVALMAYLR